MSNTELFTPESQTAPTQATSNLVESSISLRRAQRQAARDFIAQLQGEAYPNSKRLYLPGSRPDIQVAMRQIMLADTVVGGTPEAPITEPNEAVPV